VKTRMYATILIGRSNIFKETRAGNRFNLYQPAYL
jgi:hypothetical protein